MYDALVEFAARSSRTVYRSIPVTAEGNHMLEAMFAFVHTSTTLIPQPRRQVADDLREWALRTRASNPEYRLYRVFLPVTTRQGTVGTNR